jgi:hypothetical protein
MTNISLINHVLCLNCGRIRRIRAMFLLRKDISLLILMIVIGMEKNILAKEFPIY